MKGILVLILCQICLCFGYDTYSKQYATPMKNYSTEFVEKFYLSRQLMEVNNAEPHHHLNWKSLEEVNGLKNSEVAVFITSTNNRGERLLWERVMPNARTWMRMFRHAFVIIEDNFMMRFALRHCLHREYPDYSTFECHNEPTYLLTRHCTDDYYGWKGPCCKVDEMFNFLTNESPEFFKTVKYILHADDDTFFRADLVMKWLAAIDNSGVAHLPLVGNADPTRFGRHGIWHIRGCDEITGTGWYQPFFMNHAALQKIKLASANHGLMDTCRNFDVTHDVGMEAYVWLFGLYHLWIPNIEINGNHKGSEIFQPTQMGVHALKHDHDHCEGGSAEDTWPDKDRYDQNLVIGCGDIDHHGPFHDPKKQADMYDAWEYFRDHGKELEFGKAGELEWIKAKVTLEPQTAENEKIRIKEILPNDAKLDADGKYHGQEVHERVIPLLLYVGGYNETKHGKENDIINGKWKEFTLKDCSPPGTIGR